MNWLDKAISFVFPKAAANRLRARRLIEVYEEMASRKYEGADSGRRTSGWFTSGNSANAEIGPSIHKLRERSRDLARNNPYAHAAVSTLTANVIGAGIIPQAQAKNKKTKDRVMELWSRWGETTECDADGIYDFYGLQSLIMRTVVESGECLVRRRRRRSTDGLSVPLQIQVLEPDFIDTQKEGATEGGGYIIQGIEFNAIGKRVAYWLFQSHPGERSIATFKSMESIRVPAEDILHIYRPTRPGQVRGVPEGTSVYLRLRDFDEYEDAQLVRQKIAACFTAFVQDLEMPVDLAKAKKKFGGEQIEPGAIELLPPGKTVTFANPPGVQNYGEYASSVLHAVASGYGVTYEAMTRDYSQVNFSSGRMGWLEFHRNIEQWQWHVMIPRLCMPVWAWFMEAASIAGHANQQVPATWTPPRREMIDPTKEVAATIKAIRGGIMTLQQAIREQGFEPAKHLEEIKDGFDQLDELGIKLDSDPRNLTAGGMTQPEVKGDDDGTED